MDNAKSEVRAHAQRCAEDAYNTALAAQRGENVSESCTTIASRATDAIMSALKRVPGVVVKELEWEKIGGDIWRAETPTGGAYFKVLLSGSLNAGRWWHSTNTADKFDMPFDQISATVQADFAKRITSAVEPSCVVTDEMVDKLALQIAERRYLRPHKNLGHDPNEADGFYYEWMNERDFAREILTGQLNAALSSRTEEEVRADERERLARRIREQGRAINDDWGWCSAIADAIDCDFTVLNKPPARSLTNGGE